MKTQVTTPHDKSRTCAWKYILYPALFLMIVSGAPAQQCLDVTCAPAKTVNCDATWSFDPPTVVDTCCSNVFVVPGKPVSTGICPQYVTQTWQIFDNCGHSNFCSQTVTVVNTNQPVFQGANNITVTSCTSTQVFYNVTAAEACCGNLTVTCSPPSGFSFPPGLATFVTCSTTDCCGNAYSTQFYVHVLQNQSIQVYGTDKYVACGDTNWTFDRPTVYDSCCPGNYTFYPQPPVTNGIACPLTITEVWGVTDSCGNSNYCTETVYVTNAPTACCVETNGVKYIQPPNLIPGMGSDLNTTSGFLLADDFPCTNTGPITDIHLWGSWQNDQVDSGASFVLAIWSDVPNDPLTGTSHPGQLLWTQTFNPGDYAMCPYTSLQEGFYEIYQSGAGYSSLTGYSTNLDYLCFNLFPTNGFTQAGTAAAPTNYWLSVTEQASPGVQLYFGWKSSAQAYNHQAVWGYSFYVTDPANATNWTPTVDPVSSGALNLAFKINTATNAIPTNPPPCCLDTGGVKYLQSPDLVGGFDINATFSPPDPFYGLNWVLADDFPCTNSGPITDIHLWGSWLNDLVDYGATFTLAIWSDVPAAGAGDGIGYSHPGIVLWTQSFTNGQYVICPYTNQLEGFYDLGREPLGSSSNLYYLCFNAETNNLFHQTGTQAAKTNYWLSVAVQSTDPVYQSFFGWKSSSQAYNDAAVYAASGALYPLPTDWIGMNDAQGLPINLAFKINTATNTGPVLTNACPGSLYAFSEPIGTDYSTLDTVSASGTIPRFGVGENFNPLAYAAPDLGYGPDLFYAIQNNNNNFSTLYSISPSGVIAPLMSFDVPQTGCGGQSFSALTFAAPDLGFGPNLLCGVMTAANGASCLLYTSVNSSGTLPLGIGSGSGFLDLAFAAPDLGYGSNLFYAISSDPSSGSSELYTISMPGGAVVPRASLGSGFTWAGLVFVPEDLGSGANLFYALAADHTGGSFLLTMTAQGVMTERGTLAPFGLGSGKLAYRPSPFSFQCPANIVRVTPGTSATVNYPVPVPPDNCCSNVTIICVPPPGSVFGPGTTTVNCLAVDCAGHTNTCSFTVDVITLSVPPALSGNLTFNGSFESSNHPGSGAIYSSDPSFTLPGWTWSSGSNQISLEYGQPAGFPRYADGNQAVAFHGNGRPVSISQTVETTPGQNYILRFAQSDENNAGPSCSQLTVGVAGLLRVFSLTNDSGNHLWDDHGYRMQAMHFTARSNWTTLTFTDTSAAGCPSPFLDSVCVNPGSAYFVGTGTPVPGGTSNFSNFPGDPVLSGNAAAFLGTDADGNDGLYYCPSVPLQFLIQSMLTNPPPPVIQSLANTATLIPGGNGVFARFDKPAISSSSGVAVFVGFGSSNQAGLFADDFTLPSPLAWLLANAITPFPGGHGNFTAFIPAGGEAGLSPSISGNTAVFWALAADGYEGICVTPTYPTNPAPHISAVVGSTTAVPGGTGVFNTFVNSNVVSINPQPVPWRELALSGNVLGFYGAGIGGQQGIYAANVAIPVPVPWIIANDGMAIPNGRGNFTGFLGLDLAAGPAAGEYHIAFVGLGSGGQLGVYEDDGPFGDPPAPPHPPKFVADTNTLIPGGLGTFTGFTGLACGGSYGVSIAFVGTGANGQKGIYAIPVPDASGASPFPLTKIIDLNDTLDGKTIADLEMGAGAIDGATLAFKAVFTDGTQGLYAAPVIDNLFITSFASTDTNAEQIGFTAPAGYSYGLQSTPDLGKQDWVEDTNQLIPGNGGNAIWVNPVYQNGRARFYRAYKFLLLPR